MLSKQIPETTCLPIKHNQYGRTHWSRSCIAAHGLGSVEVHFRRCTIFGAEVPLGGVRSTLFNENAKHHSRESRKTQRVHIDYSQVAYLQSISLTVGATLKMPVGKCAAGLF